MATQADLLNVLSELHAGGQRRVRAGMVAERLWPGARTTRMARSSRLAPALPGAC